MQQNSSAHLQVRNLEQTNGLQDKQELMYQQIGRRLSAVNSSPILSAVLVLHIHKGESDMASCVMIAQPKSEIHSLDGSRYSGLGQDVVECVRRFEASCTVSCAGSGGLTIRSVSIRSGFFQGLSFWSSSLRACGQVEEASGGWREEVEKWSGSGKCRGKCRPFCIAKWRSGVRSGACAWGRGQGPLGSAHQLKHLGCRFRAVHLVDVGNTLGVLLGLGYE